MDYIKYFKSQAKKFYKDFQTQYKKDGEDIYSYNPKFWLDIDDIIISFDIDEDDFSLMKAQHLIAYLANFDSWNDLLHANSARLELGYHLIEHRENMFLDYWQSYSVGYLSDLDDYAKLDVFKYVFLETH